MSKKCDVIKAECEHYIYQLDSNGEVAIRYCTHTDNPSKYEGNCNHTLCPITTNQVFKDKRKIKKERRKKHFFIDPDRRKNTFNRRGNEIKRIEREKRKEFERHLKAQR